MAHLTKDKIETLAAEAFKAFGYPTFRYEDGSVGVVRCPAKAVRLMNIYQRLLVAELDRSNDPPEPHAGSR